MPFVMAGTGPGQLPAEVLSITLGALLVPPVLRVQCPHRTDGKPRIGTADLGTVQRFLAGE